MPTAKQLEQAKKYTEMKWYAVGHDFGNGDIKDVLQQSDVNAKPAYLSMASATAFVQVNLDFIRNLGIGIGKKRDSQYIQLEGEQAFAIGQFALEQSQSPWNGRGDLKRYTYKYSVRGLLYHAANLVPDEEFGLYIVTGLPTETFIKNLTLREEIKKGLNGTYRFNIGGKWRTCRVEVGNVVMEGAGALIAYSNQNPGDTSKESAVIDIGGRTTDLYVARGQEPLMEYCKGKPLGVEAVGDLLKNQFEVEYGRELKPHEIRQCLLAYASRVNEDAEKVAYPLLTAYGQEIPREELHKLTKGAVEQVANEIISFVAAAWRQSDRGDVAASFKPVINIGGGYHYFYQVLKERIRHLSAPSDPGFANARGYCILAAEQLKGKIKKAQETLAVAAKEATEAAD